MPLDLRSSLAAPLAGAYFLNSPLLRWHWETDMPLGFPHSGYKSRPVNWDSNMPLGFPHSWYKADDESFASAAASFLRLSVCKFWFAILLRWCGCCEGKRNLSEIYTFLGSREFRLKDLRERERERDDGWKRRRRRRKDVRWLQWLRLFSSFCKEVGSFQWRLSNPTTSVWQQRGTLLRRSSSYVMD